MNIKPALSTVLALACFLAACGLIPEDQHRAVRVMLGIPPDEAVDVCTLSVEDVQEVKCDFRRNVLRLSLIYVPSVPPEIGRLSHLQVLSLQSSDEITNVPPEIGQLTN